ncbi:HNH endonuclease [Sphingomonas sp. Root710]|uniref:GmrSD restriction endonuclease domain-containing protein n=1 Tax=Sphingomonas sp. Root710 TaxID=1736594 RepID=UPI0006FC12DD|nr:DUF262 domain-containing protein [Sphingomonas sp. Root710]KRB86529.1 HNH endonuclease [Sphingomonas sp. Root710]
MKIELTEITVGELAAGYKDNAEGGVVGYEGKLNIRPAYQREFIYKDRQRDAVVETVYSGFPLNVMYWSVQGEDQFEVIDGQQRTISLCQYVEGEFSVKLGSFSEVRAFHNLQEDEREKMLAYKLTVYRCEGSDSEKLEWFKTINIAGERLTDQELRNAVYHGSWVSDAKRYFSRPNCPASALGRDYLAGTPIRQDYLETIIRWISVDGDIEQYMSKHQNDADAAELWAYFEKVLDWVKSIFPTYRREMKGIEWGDLYNEYGKLPWDSTDLETKVRTLMLDDEVGSKKGIYLYLLSGKERHLSIRTFSESQKREAYEQQQGICPVCKDHFEIQQMEADHIDPWHSGGKTVAANCQMLCLEDNRRKSGR